jgi:dipeptidyl aminopeptidase/acylaminoacyl peptidase
MAKQGRAAPCMCSQDHVATGKPIIGAGRYRAVVGFLSAVGLVLAPAPTAWAQAISAPLPVRDAMEIRAFVSRMPVVISPDGQRVAYTVRTSYRFPTFTDFFAERGIPGEAFESQVRVTHTRTGETHELTPSNVNSWGPTWSPDGTRLAFYSDQDEYPHVWAWDAEIGRSRRLSDEIARPSWNWQVPRWSPDGRSIVVKLLPTGTEVEQQDLLARRTSVERTPEGDELTARVFSRRSPAGAVGVASQEVPAWFPGAYGGDLAVIDVATGVARRLTADLMPAWWGISPDGEWVAFTHIAGRDAATDESFYTLAVVPMTGGTSRELRRALRQTWGTGVSWSPRDPLLAFVSDDPATSAGVFVADARTGESRRLVDARPGWSHPYRGPPWAPDGAALYFTTSDSLWELRIAEPALRAVAGVLKRDIIDALSDHADRVTHFSQGSAVLRTRDPATGFQGFFRVSLADGTVQRLIEEPGSYGTHFSTGVDTSGTVVVLSHSNATRPPDLWLAGADLRRVRRLTQLNLQFDRYALGEPRLIEWQGEDDEVRRGALLLPPGYRDGHPVPLIVQVYGGSNESQYLHSFLPQLHLLATRGFAVLMPDVPARVGTPMRDIAEGVNMAVNQAVSLGIADSIRLGLLGHSYGGYSVLSVLVQTQRFRAAVASASQGNMFGMYSRMTPDGREWVTWSERGQGRMGATPWELRERYIANSPYFYLDRVTTPLLLLHGGSDINTPAYLAEETFTALLRLGQTVEYVRYEGENHTYRMWRLENQVDYWQRIVDWFEHHLRPGAR